MIERRKIISIGGMIAMTKMGEATNAKLAQKRKSR